MKRTVKKYIYEKYVVCTVKNWQAIMASEIFRREDNRQSMKQYILAVETGGTKIQLALGTAEGDILFRHRDKVEKEAGFQGILDKVMEALPLLKSKAQEQGGEIQKIGIGFGGPVDTEKGTAIWSAQIDGWKDFPVTSWFAEHTGIPTYLFNDSNAAAWGEYCKGSGRGSKIFFYTNIGSGVGGGIIIDGKLFDGQGRGAAEIGQTYLYDPRYAGKSVYPVNAVEKNCSGWGLQQKMRNDNIPATSVLWELCGNKQEDITCELWAKGIAQKDEYCLKILEEEAEFFAIVLCNAICFYSPQIIAIGGGVSLIGEPLLERIRYYVSQYVYQNNKDNYKIVKSELDEDVVLVGTLLLTGSK